MKRFAELMLRLLRPSSGGTKKSPENVAEDDRLALRIVARLRTECEKPQAHSHADKIA
jgi:hypothetical protein